MTENTATQPAHSITSLEVKNYKGVREIKLHPHGSLVVIAGGNGEGKSSFIDAIAEIFDPVGVRLTPKPLREGETEGFAEITTSAARIRRTWTADDAGTLRAYTLEGKKQPGTAKQFVIEATGGAVFDPEEFASLSGPEQRERLLALSTLPDGLDLAALAAERATAYDARRLAGQAVKAATSSLADHPAPAAGTPTEEASATEILAEHEAARALNARIQSAHDVAAAAERSSAEADSRAVRLEDELEEARAYATRATEAMDAALTVARSAPPIIDLDTITAKLTSIETNNRAVRAGKEHAAAKLRVLAAKEAEAGFQQTLDSIDKTKMDGLKAAVFPVDGLGITDDGITFEGIPFGQINTAEKVLIALDMLTIPQPDLRLVIIKNGDLLDATTLGKVDQRATQRGYLVVTERDRDESREIGFTVQGGALTGVELPEPATPAAAATPATATAPAPAPAAAIDWEWTPPPVERATSKAVSE